MNDGPSKNLKLDRRWKRFFSAAQNDAFDSTERSALASDAIVREILTDDTAALLTDLRTYARRSQSELDALASFDSIFHRYAMTSFGDTLRKELSFRLWDGTTPDAAIGKAIEASVDDHISRARNRIHEECIRLRESREMSQDQFDCTKTNVNTAFDAVTKSDICGALLRVKRNTFNNAVSKQKGLDEGPSL